MDNVQIKMEFSGIPQRPRLILTNILRNLSLATKTKQQQEIANKFSGVAKSWHVVVVAVVVVAVVVVGTCHPMDTGLVLKNRLARVALQWVKIYQIKV